MAPATGRPTPCADDGATPVAQASARFFFRQFISTVAFCHRHHIAHRDLKLDNALLDTEHPPRILLTDFGFAARWGAGETPNMRGHLGCGPAFV